MPVILIRLPSSLLLAACIALALTTTPSEHSLAARLEEIRAEHDVPALGAFRLQELERILAVAGHRTAEGAEAVEPDDGWHLGSNTKAMTATLAARLVEKGKIQWETTIAQGLPELAETMKADYRGVTLRQLLAHRGGIVGGEANPTVIPALWTLQRRDDLSPRQRRMEAARGILQRAPIHTPGEGFHYSNAGYIVAGAMLEAAGDAAWEDLMRQEIFEPLGMTSAGFGPPAKIEGHVKQEGGEEAWKALRHDNPAVLGPAGTVHASLADWSRFAAAHLGQVEGFLSAESLEILHEPVGTKEGGYALGWGLQEAEEGLPLLTHAGSNTMWYALIVIDRGKKTAYLAVCNAPSPGACADVIEALRDHHGQ